MAEISRTRDEVVDAVTSLVRHCRDDMHRRADRDLDALSEGWDYWTYPDSGYVWEAVENALRSGDAAYGELGDDTYCEVSAVIWELLQGELIGTMGEEW